MNQTLHGVVAKEKEQLKGTTKQKMARRHSIKGGNHLEQESINRRLLDAPVRGYILQGDGQSLGKR